MPAVKRLESKSKETETSSLVPYKAWNDKGLVHYLLYTGKSYVANACKQ